MIALGLQPVHRGIIGEKARGALGMAPVHAQIGVVNFTASFLLELVNQRLGRSLEKRRRKFQTSAEVPGAQKRHTVWLARERGPFQAYPMVLTSNFKQDLQRHTEQMTTQKCPIPFFL